jgi:hypothetical protein
LISLDANADVVINPEVATRGINRRVPLAELVQGDVVGRINSPAALAALNLVVCHTVAGDTRHLGLRRDVNADVVVEPEVRAF